MHRFLFVILLASFLIPPVAKAERDEVRRFCASLQVGDLTGKQLLRKVGLKVPNSGGTSKAYSYCKIYLGV
tara:strand:+ start:128 stop:340 length:213 start_codon:yes stop_codon:yes gene_type:complete